MMKTTIESMQKERKEACIFIADYAAWLFGCGATCKRIRKNVNRIAEAWQLDLETTINPGSISVLLSDKDTHESFVYIKRIPHTAISFLKNTKLSELSWMIVDKDMSLQQAQDAFQSIISAPYTNKWAVLILTSFANLAFCRIFGGDAIAMAIVFVATFAGFKLKQVLLEEHTDHKVVFLLCAFFSSVIGAAGYVFHLGNTPEVAVGTCVLYLIPGIPYINSISDLLVGQYLVSYSRFMNAIVLTFCLSIGLAGGILLMNLKLF